MTKHQALHVAGREQIALPDEVKHFIVAPGFILEALILLVFGNHGRRGFTHHAPRRVLPQRQIILPKADLRLHQLGRIGHQARGHIQEGIADMHRVGLTGLIRLALQEIRNNALAAFRHIGHGAAHQRRVWQAERGVVALGHRGFLVSFCQTLRAAPVSG